MHSNLYFLCWMYHSFKGNLRQMQVSNHSFHLQTDSFSYFMSKYRTNYCIFMFLCTLFMFWKRSEEHTSELQSRGHLVCRLLLEKKNTSPCLRRHIWCQ